MASTRHLNQHCEVVLDLAHYGGCGANSRAQDSLTSSIRGIPIAWVEKKSFILQEHVSTE
jgi:hypothetical protein